ncbi:M24 family metallopeptidase [Planctomycetota bacterium]
MELKKRNVLLLAASEHDSNMLYASGFRAPDPFVFAAMAGRTHCLVSPLEYERARKESRADEVINTAEIRTAGKKRSLATVFAAFARSFKVRRFEVPADFPLAAADELRRRRIRLTTHAVPFFPERMVKSEAEITDMKCIIRATCKAVRALEHVLEEAGIDQRKRLTHKGRLLTSEKLKSIVQVALAAEGAVSGSPIVAGGDQACDPHCSGYGVLRAHQPIVVDIFPRSNLTGFHGDITRTFIKGRPSPEQQKLYRTVRTAQRMALEMVKPRIRAATIHKAVAAYFIDQGFQTITRGDTLQGFIHSTGHGLGLDIHEAPGVSSMSKHIFRIGNVITIEPGLYYPGIGGVRIEDDVVVTPDGCEVLTKYRKRFMIE